MTGPRPRLTPGEVAQYNEDGYLVFRRPVLAPDRFEALRQYFDKILGELDADERPESMDVPHFMYPDLFAWAFDDDVLDLVEPILGPDLALFSTHFICKPKGNGKRVPWHEDSFYWKGQIEPMEVCTVWLALDPSTTENGCMYVIPRTHTTGKKGFSDYDPVDLAHNVFNSEIKAVQRDDSAKVAIEIEPNQCSLHDGRIIHGSEANLSDKRRCGWTLRFTSTAVKFHDENFHGAHQVYLAKGVDRGGNTYADPGKRYPEVMKARGAVSRYRNAH
ncbi:MAG: phytanoyl-CoA dioxygenase family protein [Fimbriimonadaceae bacterium]|nr:phytanoyl-CoA dioxygenase family protein [Fimbriimonadaceae bacterium]